ncbi:hypothetical protein HDV00_005641 [Rhizophlyctis rosea]|nr:hypothetical protein HDV00_005641 [Rhizophlyctis rosea]
MELFYGFVTRPVPAHTDVSDFYGIENLHMGSGLVRDIFEGTMPYWEEDNELRNRGIQSNDMWTETRTMNFCKDHHLENVPHRINGHVRTIRDKNLYLDVKLTQFDHNLGTESPIAIGEFKGEVARSNPEGAWFQALAGSTHAVVCDLIDRALAAPAEFNQLEKIEWGRSHYNRLYPIFILVGPYLQFSVANGDDILKFACGLHHREPVPLSAPIVQLPGMTTPFINLRDNPSDVRAISTIWEGVSRPGRPIQSLSEASWRAHNKQKWSSDYEYTRTLLRQILRELHRSCVKFQ